MVAESDVNIWPPRSSELQRCEPEMRGLTPPAICFRHLHFPHLSYHPIYFQWLGQIKNHPISNIDIFSKYLKLNCPIYNFQKKKKNIWKQEEKQYWGRIVHISGSFQRLFVQIWSCLSNCSPTLAVCWLTCRYFLRQTFSRGGSWSPSPQLCIDGALELSGSLLSGEGILYFSRYI